MKKQIIFAAILLTAALFMGCSKDNDTPSNIDKQEQNKQTVSIQAGSLRFNFIEEGFGEEIETTRVEELPKEEVADLGNGFEAHISVERDLVPEATRTPKPIADGTYTIIAYKGTERLDQKITFKVVGGVTTITSAKGRYSWVANETYTFVCFNEKMYEEYGYLLTQNGDFTGGLFDRQTITINGADQDLTFQMKHANFRVRTKVETLEEYPVITTASIPAGTWRILTGKYDLRTGVVGMPFDGPSTTPVTQTYVNSGTYTDTGLEDDFYTVTAKEYDYYIAGKPQELRLSCTAGTLYGKPLNFTHSFMMKSDEFKANGSYTVKIKLLPRYLYLFEDGQTGYLSNPIRKNHVPIAIVFDPVDRRAISLWDANNGNGVKWDTDNDYEKQRNSVMFANAVPHPALTTNTSGHVWTWEIYDSFHNSSPVTKANIPQFAAFYYAAKYYTDTHLNNKATSKSGNLSGALANDGKWYLPSWYEWKEIFEKLGLGNGSAVITWGEKPWKGSLVNYAFTVANGTSIASKNNIYYWSSSENDVRYAFIIDTNRSRMAFNSFYKNWEAPHVRPFVMY